MNSMTKAGERKLGREIKKFAVGRIRTCAGIAQLISSQSATTASYAWQNFTVFIPRLFYPLWQGKEFAQVIFNESDV